jgi:ABC-2 type transport system ATP-binding protein
MLAVETLGLSKSYSPLAAVSEIALRVPQSCVYGFVGPNGAGKTTVMRMLLGLTKADAGQVLLFGHDLATNRRRALQKVGAVIESPALYNHLTGRANLHQTCLLLGLPPTESERVLELVDLAGADKQKVGTYSLGMKQRLAIARALLGSPRLLLLDEPTNGLDPDGIMAMRAFLRDLPARISGTVFISSHLLSEVEQIADYVGLMQKGRLTLQDKVSSLIAKTSRIVIELDDPGRGGAVLKTAGFDVDVGDDRVVLNLKHDDDPHRQAADANHLLVQSGLSVSGLAPQPWSLEDVYRVALSGNRTAKEAQS